MPIPTAHPDKSTQLRTHAENRLRDGNTPVSSGTTLSGDALVVLFRLASSEQTAADGLKLLHELQTHQVELDLQHEQLVANERETAQDLAQYQALFAFAPAGYLTLTLNGQVIRTNLAGTELLGATADELCGHPVERFLAPESRPALAALLNQLNDGAARAACTVRARNVQPARNLHLAARTSPGGADLLVIFSECGM